MDKPLNGETQILIHNLQVLQREIPIEGNEQLAMMMKIFHMDIPLYIEKLRRLEELEHATVVRETQTTSPNGIERMA